MHDIEVYDLYDVWYQPWWQTTPAKVVGCILGIIILCLLVWLFIRLICASEPVPYWQKALNQCAQLKKNSDNLELPLLYAHLTALFKEYLEKRYQCRLKPLTDQELLNQLVELPLSAPQKALVQEIFTYAVPAKFDSWQDDLADPAIHIALLEQFISETRPQQKPKSPST